MSVFKFPWEKGRLAKIFTDQPIVKMRVPKLQPGRRLSVIMQQKTILINNELNGYHAGIQVHFQHPLYMILS